MAYKKEFQKSKRQQTGDSRDRAGFSDLKQHIQSKNGLKEVELDYLIDKAEWFVRTYLLYVSTHQIRRFFDAIKKIKNAGPFEARQRAKLLMLRPQLANASGKPGMGALKDLNELCTLMMKQVRDAEDFTQFANFFESLVAFHKAYAKKP